MIAEALLLAQAIGFCTRQDFEAQWWQRFHERPVATATVPAGLLIRYATEDGSTWTLIFVPPVGCVVPIASGEDWQERRWEPTGNPA